MDKTYYIPKSVRLDWIGAKESCESFEMELATLETLSEANAVIDMCETTSYNIIGRYPMIDGVSLVKQSGTDWYFLNTGEKVAYTIPWQVNQPDYAGGNEMCMSLLGEANDRIFRFNDVPCKGLPGTFICQKVTSKHKHSDGSDSSGH